MKANEITNKQVKEWDERGLFPVACRICDEVILFPKENYTEEQCIGYECFECRVRKELIGLWNNEVEEMTE